MKPVVNIADVKFVDVKGAGGAFEAKVAPIAAQIGSIGIGCMVISVPPGKKAFPFHVHHNTHELFVILEGAGEYRFGGETYPIRAGDVLAAPAGAGVEFAHQIVNSGDSELKYLGISDKSVSDVVEYPDSNKFGVRSRFDWNNPGGRGLVYIGRKDSAVDYYDGEK